MTDSSLETILYVFPFSSTDLFTLKCQSAVGVIGQTTHISCSIEAKDEAVIKDVILTRTGEEKACFTFQPIKNIVRGDPRFKVVNLASLQLHNTRVSDEGEYKYLIRTSLGSNTAKFTISVTGKRKISSCSHFHYYRVKTAPLFLWLSEIECIL